MLWKSYLLLFLWFIFHLVECSYIGCFPAYFLKAEECCTANGKCTKAIVEQDLDGWRYLIFGVRFHQRKLLQSAVMCKNQIAKPFTAHCEVDPNQLKFGYLQFFFIGNTHFK